ncbi:MAG: hypothetical protein ACJAV2_003702 [Myxococcota bacterium]
MELLGGRAEVDSDRKEGAFQWHPRGRGRTESRGRRKEIDANGLAIHNSNGKSAATRTRQQGLRMKRGERSGNCGVYRVPARAKNSNC